MPATIIGFIFMYTILLGRASFVKLKRQFIWERGRAWLIDGPILRRAAGKNAPGPGDRG
jgi:hypothetical protein